MNLRKVAPVRPIRNHLAKRSLIAAALVVGFLGVSMNTLVTGASASVLGGSPVASCVGVSVTLTNFVASTNENSITLVVGAASSTQTFPSPGTTVSFPWSSIGVNAAAGGTTTYSFTWTDTTGETGTLGPYTFNAASCVVTTTTAPATPTTVAAVTTTLPPTTVAPTTVPPTTAAPVVAARTQTATKPKHVAGGGGAGKPIAAATTVHTGEPWAGSGPLVVAITLVGLTMIGLGERLRRRQRRIG